MKHLFLLLCAVVFSSNLFSQKVITNPRFHGSTASGLTITKVVVDDTKTTLHCQFLSENDTKFSIPKKTFIQENESETKLYVSSISSPHSLGKWIKVKSHVPLNITLSFPALTPEAKSITYGEDNNGGNWNVYDIELMNQSKLSYLPEAYYGEWFSKDETQDWKVSFREGVVIYQNAILETPDSEKKGKYYHLQAGATEMWVRLKDDILYIGTDKKNLFPCVKEKSVEVISSVRNSKLELPPMGFKSQKTTIHGFLTNYGPKLGKTGTYGVRNTLLHEDEEGLISINEDGSFTVEVDLYCTSTCYILLPNARTSWITLIPGTTQTYLFSSTDQIIMGDHATVLSHLQHLTEIRHFDPYKIRTKIGEMEPNDYLDYCDGASKEDLKEWQEYVKKQNLPDGIKDFGLNYLKMNSAQNKLSYEINKSSALRKKNKGSKVRPVFNKLTLEDLSFLEEINLNDPYLLMTSNFYFFINRLQYNDAIREQEEEPVPTTFENIMQLLSEEVELSEEEQQSIKNWREFNNHPLVKAKNEYINDNLKAFTSLYQKYGAILNTMSEEEKERGQNTGMQWTLDYLEKQDTVSLLTEERILLEGAISMETPEYLTLIKSYEGDVETKVKTLYSTHSSVINSLLKNKRLFSSTENFVKLFGTKGQMIADIFLCSGLAPKIESGVSYTPKQLQAVEAYIETPFIKEYLGVANKKLAKRLETNKLKKGYHIHNTPVAEGEALFAKLMEPFAGKTVYIDFWATWCGPCRSGMKNVIPLKDELKDREDIAFVYITNETSPEAAWKAMIPDIKGEHYRLGPDEWNYLKTKFGISGIPHYVIVDSNGEVANNDSGIDPHNLAVLKTKLLQFAELKEE